MQQFCARIVIFPELWLLEQGQQGDKSDGGASATAPLAPSPRQKIRNPADAQHHEPQHRRQMLPTAAQDPGRDFLSS